MLDDRLILASASPQRKKLLEGLGIAFDIIPPSRPETDCIEVEAVARCKALAKLKAEDVASRHSDAWVLGCDTLVVAADGTLLEKPTDADDARRMLKLLSGKACTVHSTLCLLSPSGETFEGLSSSKVQFKPLSNDDIEWWMRTGHWQDRSGAFQIDGKGQFLISRIEGDYTGVVGLPVFLLGELAKRADLWLFE